ncbi:hypothetical protein [Herbiconiux liukaitaii]|uniref:hypothetical protein n=1 Tax=Herbiconiux liukaitaii TaxID=3342799 RepID=UPI0035B96260
MNVNDVPAVVPQYWGTLTQIVPVFALALVLEARRLASTWTITKKKARRWSAAWFAAVAVFLFTILFWGLNTLASGRSEPWQVTASLVLILVAAAMLAIQPVIGLAIGGNVDAVLHLTRSLPLSKWAKSNRRFSKWNTELQEILVRTLEREEQAKALLEMSEVLESEASTNLAECRARKAQAPDGDQSAIDEAIADAEREEAAAIKTRKYAQEVFSEVGSRFESRLDALNEAKAAHEKLERRRGAEGRAQVIENLERMKKDAP